MDDFDWFTAPPAGGTEPASAPAPAAKPPGQFDWFTQMPAEDAVNIQSGRDQDTYGAAADKAVESIFGGIKPTFDRPKVFGYAEQPGVETTNAALDKHLEESGILDKSFAPVKGIPGADREKFKEFVREKYRNEFTKRAFTHFDETSGPANRPLEYLAERIPVMGQVVAGDRDSYQYLVESIRKFPDQETFATMIRAAGFGQVTYRNLTMGVAALHSGWKL